MIKKKKQQSKGHFCFIWQYVITNNTSIASNEKNNMCTSTNSIYYTIRQYIFLAN